MLPDRTAEHRTGAHQKSTPDECKVCAIIDDWLDSQWAKALASLPQTSEAISTL